MALVINPDGTVTTVEVEWDSNGNLRPKRGFDIMNTHDKPKTVAKNSFSSKKKKNKNVIKPQPEVKPKVKVYNVEMPPPSSGITDVTKLKRTRIITRQSLEKFFIRKKNLHQIVTNEEFLRATSVLKGLLLEFFLQKYEQYKEYCSEMGWGKKFPIIQKVKNKNKNKKQKKYVNPPQRKHTTSGNTIADIAKFSTIKDSLSDSDVIYHKSESGAIRHPKYGYARDRYGRVQERDSFNEERKNEFRQAQRHQSNYDYSSYDAEDDHDSYYDSGGYE